MTSPWALYDALLADVPEDANIDEVVAGAHWLVVRAGALCGMSMRYWEAELDETAAQGWVGRPLAHLAALVKSWHFAEAALGLAALNASCNRPDRVRRLWRDEALDERRDAFTAQKAALAGKKVAVIGGFPGLPEPGYCEMSVLERRPGPGHLPDTACEYILPDQDFIFATGTTLINKTLPRLLQLKGNSRFSLVGPSAPLHPLLYSFGVDVLAGVLVEDSAKLIWSVKTGACHQVFSNGAARVNLPRELLRADPHD